MMIPKTLEIIAPISSAMYSSLTEVKKIFRNFTLFP